MYIYAILYIYIYSRICFFITTTHINNYIHHFLGLSIQHIYYTISTNFLVNVPNEDLDMEEDDCMKNYLIMRNKFAKKW